MAGLVGPSGSGKTTTADLITGLLTPQTGRISVAGLDLTPARLKAWRAGLAYVPQDLFLLHDTVRANLLWGRSIHDDKSLWAALDVVGAAHLVSSLERGLDTPVGERGVRLSGGERQRLILARALLLQPQLLILDEALSALPQADEAQIISDLRRNYGELTIVLITHRTQTASLCDQQLVFATDPSASSP